MLDAENTETAEPSAPAATETPAETAGDTEGTTGDVPASESPTDSSAAGSTEGGAPPAKKAAAKRTAAKKTPAKKATTAKKTAAKRTSKKAVAAGTEAAPDAAVAPVEVPTESTGETAAPAEATEAAQPAKKTAKKAAAKRAPAKRTAKKTAEPSAGAGTPDVAEAALFASSGEVAPEASTESRSEAPSESPTGAPTGAAQAAKTTPPPATALLFQPPDPTKAVVTRRRRTTKAESAEGDETVAKAELGETEAAQKPAKKAARKPAKKSAAKAEPEQEQPEAETEEPTQAAEESGRGEGDEEQGGERRRRRRGGRRRRRSGGGEDNESAESGESGESGEEASGGEEGPEQGAQGGAEEGEEAGPGGTRRRRRRRRSGEGGEAEDTEGGAVTTRVRKPRNAEDEITALSGSTRLEAKKQRRREGREAGRRRAPIVSEAEFLARRESVDRVMVIRQRKDLTQIAVLEDKVLVEHYVSRESQTSLIGNVYLGRVQNVLPSMEAAFIDIGKGRNAVLYAGEVNWDALGAKNGSPRKIEAVLKSGQPILVQVTKDPIGHKGARLTSQISLPGRFLVYVPDGTTSGISRKLPDTERNRLKTLLKDIVPDTAGVIVRTAAEGASEEELTRDVERLTARWADIESKAGTGNAPQLLYGEPDLTLKVVRDLFTEDFNKLVIAGDDAWDLVDGYVSHVAPDLADRLERYDGDRDVFAEYRIDEQIEKALDRKVWLPSGGSLVIDRTEAMTVVDVNTGKFTGSGGNLEETVTKNNLEAAEEIVRQLRLRDIGGIIVVDFIDMVLESNRDLVLRRLVECLGRDRTRHQVAEVTSLGLVQMTRKRIGTGLLEAFSETCEHCQGRGLVMHHEPVDLKKKAEDESRRGRRGGRGRGRDEAAAANGGGVPSPKDIAAMAKAEERAEEKAEEAPAEKRGETRAEPETEQAATEVAATDGGEPTEKKPAGRARGRGRGGRGRGAKEAEAGPAAEISPDGAPATPTEATEQPSEQPASDARGEAAAETTGDARDESSKGAEETPTEAAPVEPAAPAAPKIVTTVRRRSARRAAGPPPAVAGPTAAPEPVAVPAAASDPAGGDEATDEPSDVDPLATLVDDAEVESTGTATLRGDSEAADGPPGSLGPDVTDTAAPSADGGDLDGAPEGTPAATPHVPVKKRGSRRR
jgi:ribonuclease E